MRELVLFRVGSYMTILSIEPSGKVAISSGGVGGEYYLLIEPDDKPALLSALAKASDKTLPNTLTAVQVDELVVVLINALFTTSKEDPSIPIRAFLDE